MIYTQYATDVLQDKFPSGPLARASVQRMQAWHKKKDRYFDEDEVKRVFSLFSLFKHTSGEYGGRPFALLPWQAWIIGQIFGWRYKSNKRRVIRKVYIEVAKKNGKTELAAAVGLIMAFFDGEYGAEVYSAANKLEQAKICWGSAAAMVRFLKRDSPVFDKMVELHDSFNNSKIFRRETNSKFIPIASDSKTLDGLRPNAAIIDEFHESIDDSVLRNLESGMVNRAQPLLFIITTAGFNINGVCYQYRKVVADIVEGRSEDDINLQEWSAAPHRKLNDIEGWKEANPALGRTIDISAIKARMSDPTEVFMTECLSMWVTTMNSPWPLGSFNACMQPNLQLKPDRPTWLGLEISPERTSWALTGTQVLDDGSIAVGLMECVESEYAILVCKIDGFSICVCIIKNFLKHTRFSGEVARLAS